MPLRRSRAPIPQPDSHLAKNVSAHAPATTTDESSCTQIDSSFQSIVTTRVINELDIGLVSLRLTFGGSPYASIFTELSEPLVDLANALARCPKWDASETLDERYR
jgi:hypothetical protein